MNEKAMIRTVWRVATDLSLNNSERLAALDLLRSWAQTNQDAAAAVKEIEAGQPAPPPPDDSNSPPTKRSNALTRLGGLFNGTAIDLFHSANNNAFATVQVSDHKETWNLKSSQFKMWLSRLFFDALGQVPSVTTLNDQLRMLTGLALFDAPQHEVFVRVAEHDGNLYIDLADEQWRAVEVGPQGWRVVDEPPVKFIRSQGQLPLPEPIQGGDPREIFDYVNITNRHDQVLYLTWIIAALRPRGPYPILALHGQHGSAKSMAEGVALRLVDPSEATFRSAPDNERDLAIAATHAHAFVFDNLSAIPSWLSDALCRLSTGGGFVTRRLRTDSDLTIFSGRRPVLLNGITELASRADLLDRTITLKLPRIEERQRRDEDAFLDAFRSAQPRIFGALLTALSAALKNIGDVHLSELPRMADFAKLGGAAEQALGFEPGEFMAAYKANHGEANRTAIDSSPIGSSLVHMLDGRGALEGTADALLRQLNQQFPDAKRDSSWPKTPRAFSNALTRIEPNLAAEGIHVTRWRAGRYRDRMIKLERSSAASISSASKPNSISAADGADEADDRQSAAPTEPTR